MKMVSRRKKERVDETGLGLGPGPGLGPGLAPGSMSMSKEATLGGVGYYDQVKTPTREANVPSAVVGARNGARNGAGVGAAGNVGFDVHIQESMKEWEGSLTGEEDLGWFHGKIRMEKKIQWATNYKIQFFMFALFLAGLICSIALSLEVEGPVGLFSGASITIITSSAVIYTYARRPSWRKHPNPLIFSRSVCDLCFVFVLLVTETVKCSAEGCQTEWSNDGCVTAAGFTQFFLFASESWFFVMAIDMQQSLRTPFTDFKWNMKKYHWFVWGCALITALVLVASGSAGISEFGYCWTKRPSDGESDLSTTQDEVTQNSNFWDLNTRSWLFFYVWLMLYWAFGIGVTVFAWRRLKEGLAETLRMRLRVLHSVTLYVITIIIYWALTFAVYVPYLILEVPKCSPDCSDTKKWISQLMTFMITCRGYFDFIVWFQINELSYSDAFFKTSDEKKKDVDVDVDLSPQVNLALRCEVLYYTTSGIIQAVKDAHHLPPGATQQELFLQPQGSDMTSTRGSLGVDDYLTSHHTPRVPNKQQKGTLFIDYCPHSFRTIREHFGIDSNQYMDSLSKTTKERLSEGASGAFMFFSHDQKLIVKSLSQEEASFLRSIAVDYAAFLLNNPNSLLTRFYGCHAIKLYGGTFNFVVMANLFATDQVIHRRYDIKGSWIHRSATHPSNGKRVTCRHCNASYIFGSTSPDAMSCPARVGKHEPNVVLKDNDLTSKVRLNPRVAEQLYEQLMKDANFLARLGIMDYSLLLGIHNVEYRVAAVGDEDDNRSGGYGCYNTRGAKSGQPLRNRSIVDRGLARSLTNKPPTTSNATKLRNYARGVSTTHSVKEEDGNSNAATQSMESLAGAPMLEEEKAQREGLPRLFTGTRRANTVVGPSFYYFGIIDILQTWNVKKRAERFTKVHLLRQDPDGLSAVPPTIYKDRFSLKMADILGIALHNEDDDMSDDALQSRQLSPFSIRRYA